MDNHFTRSKQTLIDSVPNYNTRLQSRLRERASSQFNIPEKHLLVTNILQDQHTI